MTPPRLARDLMSAPVRTITPTTTITQAQQLLLRHGHSALIVLDKTPNPKQFIAGIITRRDLDLAQRHGFADAPVQGHMTTHLHTIAPTTPLPDIEQHLASHDIGRLPVLEAGELVGIITRKDLLRARQAQRNADQQQTQQTQQQDQQTPALLQQLRDRLPPPTWTLLQTAAHQAEAQGWHLYLIGGGVRDLLLAQANNQPLHLQDIDLIVDGYHRALTPGAGVHLAQTLQTQYPNSQLEIHGKFQTAALKWTHSPALDSLNSSDLNPSYLNSSDLNLGNLELDIATARTEYYPYPAANPEVEASSIRQDLCRRDFTINALALRLTHPQSGELLDFFGGQQDLQNRTLRILHNHSFIEDPTRIYRGIRFAQRLHFQFHPQTLTHLHYALHSGIYDRSRAENGNVPALQTRLRTELQLLLSAPTWKPALQQLGQLQALRCLHPSLQLTPELWHQIRFLDRALTLLQTWGIDLRNDRTLPAPWLLRLEQLLASLPPSLPSPPPPLPPTIAQRLQLPTDSIRRLTHLPNTQTTLQQSLATTIRPSQIYDLLKPIDLPILLLLLPTLPKPQQRSLWQYLTQWRNLTSPLNGRDLQDLGYPPGKPLKKILKALLTATLDGELNPTAPDLRTQAIAFLNNNHPLP